VIDSLPLSWSSLAATAGEAVTTAPK